MKHKFSIHRPEITPEDESNLKVFVNHPFYKSFKKSLNNRIADLNESLLEKEDNGTRERIKELADFIQGFENLVSEMKEEDLDKHVS